MKLCVPEQSLTLFQGVKQNLRPNTVKCSLPSIQQKITRRAKQQEDMTCNWEKKNVAMPRNGGDDGTSRQGY